MKKSPWIDAEKWRWKEAPPQYHSVYGDRHGIFNIYHEGSYIRVIVSSDEGWDHVSISLKNRCPKWAEMCFIKDMFFDPEEVAIQYHPAKSEYVNHHPYCLHIFKPHGVELPRPPKIMIGPS